MSVVPGLLFAVTKPFDPNLTEQEFNDWYNNKHIVDVVNCGLAANGFRYRNADPSASWPYLAIYRLPDLKKLYDPVFMVNVPTDSPKSWGKGYMPDVAKAELRGYELVRVFEPTERSRNKDGYAKVLVNAEIESDESPEEFVVTFAKDHLGSINGQDGYRRSMLYKSAEAFVPRESKSADDERAGTEFHAAQQQRLTYLAVYEFDQAPADVAAVVKGKNVGVWNYITEYGTGLYRIEPTPGRR
ncbi:hypothetical protein SEUCBS140593_006037 [Sporothrix eucalyptigena]|uniref:Uncharacterized protein n=1 Tax=Sporothrix eucalyptigena TaxID=1812306 RepID=A0ABP0C1S3_9PEZI